MPIVQRTNLNQNTVLAVWKITETREELYAQKGNRITDSGKNLHDNIHWLASRVLLQELFDDVSIELLKDELNKPALLINGQPFAVSITHSYAYAAVMVSSGQAVAIDLEKIDTRVNRVARKFIRPDEDFDKLGVARNSLNLTPDEQTTLYYTIIWSAKETLYKYYSKKELDFLANLRIAPFVIQSDECYIEGMITKNDYQLKLPIAVKLFDGYVMTYNKGD
jgi:4'-phosphopantetheinyl transferase